MFNDVISINVNKTTTTKKTLNICEIFQTAVKSTDMEKRNVYDEGENHRREALTR
jgi:hypothetical protein